MSKDLNQIKIVTLTRDLLDLYLPQLIILDQAAQHELSDAYSNESWGIREFSQDLPDKWAYSAFATRGERVHGFWISSRKTPALVYTYRVTVEKAMRQLGIGKTLFEFVLCKARSDNCQMMGLSVSVRNSDAIRFYEGLGFVRVTGDRIWSILGKKANGFTIKRDYYEIPSGHRNYVYVLYLNGRR